MRLSPGYLGLALLVLLVEIYIALAVHDRLVRPHGGDALVVVLLYCLVRGLCDWSPRRVAGGVLLFAFAVEAAQALRLLERLRLDGSPLLRVVVGTDFDPGDLVAYAVGAALVLVVERLRRRRAGAADPAAAA